MPDRILAGMPKRRIPQIMRQSRRRNDVAKIRPMRREPVPLANHCARPRSERPPHARNFQRMRESRAYVIIIRQRKNLRLILQPPERRRKRDAIRIPPKLRPLRIRWARLSLAPESVRRKELAPLHTHISASSSAVAFAQSSFRRARSLATEPSSRLVAMALPPGS